MNGITRYIDSVEPLQGWGISRVGALPGCCPSLMCGRPFGAEACRIAPQYARPGTDSEVAEPGFNLNIPRYVDTFRREKKMVVKTTQKEIEMLQRQLVGFRNRMMGYLKELRA